MFLLEHRGLHLQYKRVWLEGNNSSCSFRAHGKLLHVVDAVFVNQTDGEGRQVQDETFVELLENKEIYKNSYKRSQAWQNPWSK